jgi:hypothetical protein
MPPLQHATPGNAAPAVEGGTTAPAVEGEEERPSTVREEKEGRPATTPSPGAHPAGEGGEGAAGVEERARGDRTSPHRTPCDTLKFHH